MTISEQELISIVILALIIPIVFGIINGLKGKIVVFRSYDDLWLVFLAVIVPIALFFICAALQSVTMTVASCIAEVVILSTIAHRTYIDNRRNIFLTLLALYTKLPLSGLFILQFISYLYNLSKPLYRRTTGIATLVSIICLAPLIHRLIKNKKGIFY